MSETYGKVAVVFGASTELGLYVVRSLLQSRRIETVYALAARDMRAELGVRRALEAKLVLLVESLDFVERTLREGVPEADLAFCCVGSSKRRFSAMGGYDAHRLNVDYPKRFLYEVFEMGVQRVAILSHACANSANRRSEFARVKGEVEDYVKALQQEQEPVGPGVSLFKVPLILTDERDQDGDRGSAIGVTERVRQRAAKKLAPGAAFAVHVRDIAKAMCADALAKADIEEVADLEIASRSKKWRHAELDGPAIVKLANTTRRAEAEFRAEEKERRTIDRRMARHNDSMYGGSAYGYGQGSAYGYGQGSAYGDGSAYGGGSVRSGDSAYGGTQSGAPSIMSGPESAVDRGLGMESVGGEFEEDPFGDSGGGGDGSGMRGIGGSEGGSMLGAGDIGGGTFVGSGMGPPEDSNASYGSSAGSQMGPGGSVDMLAAQMQKRLSVVGRGCMHRLPPRSPSIPSSTGRPSRSSSIAQMSPAMSGTIGAFPTSRSDASLPRSTPPSQLGMPPSPSLHTMLRPAMSPPMPPLSPPLPPMSPPALPMRPPRHPMGPSQPPMHQRRSADSLSLDSILSGNLEGLASPNPQRLHRQRSSHSALRRTLSSSNQRRSTHQSRHHRSRSGSAKPQPQGTEALRGAVFAIAGKVMDRSGQRALDDERALGNTTI